MTKQINIMLVDDSKQITSALQLLFADDGMRNIIAVNRFEKAIETLKQEEIDIAVLDIQLPDGSGLELLRKIKEEQPRIIVLMLSNNSDACHRAFAKIEGADYFFDKSLEFEAAARTIDNIIKNEIYNK